MNANFVWGYGLADKVELTENTYNRSRAEECCSLYKANHETKN